MEPPYHSDGPNDPSYYGNHYSLQPYPYYPSSSAATSHLDPHQNLLHFGSTSDSSPHFDRGGHAPAAYPTSSYTDTSPSSFESHGSTHGHGVPPYVGYHLPPPPPPHAYHYPPPPHAYHPVYTWPLPAPIEYVSDVKPADVLSGRGGATNSHCKCFLVVRATPRVLMVHPNSVFLLLAVAGNRNFRATVKQFQERYLKAKKRDKPSVAVELVRLIRKNGGRFLQRCDTPGPRGECLYYDIGRLSNFWSNNVI
jgi:hypothetical protein